MNVLNHKDFKCDSFRDWVHFRGIKLVDIKSLDNISDPKIVAIFFELTQAYFRTNPSFSEGSLVTEIVLDLILNNKNDLIPKLNLSDRFQWPKQVNDWMAELVRLRESVHLQNLMASKVTKKHSKDFIKTNSTQKTEQGVQFKIQPVSNGVYISAFVSNSSGMKQLLLVLENLQETLEDSPTKN